MSSVVSSSVLPGRLAPILGALRGALARRMAAVPALAPLLTLAWRRLHRLERRFAALVRRGAASPAPPARPPRPRALAPAGGSGPGDAPAARERLPTGFAWLVRLVPEAASHGAQLQHLLAEPEVADVLATLPGAGRVLRPLCRMLGIAPVPPLPLAAPPAPGPAGGGRQRRGAADPPPLRPRRCRIPRTPGRAWLRWRPAGAGP